MPGKSPFALSDEPITNSQEDKLNRQAFAKGLAHVICRLDREKSTVLALTGAWGSGKTSIKNLLVKELEPAENQPRVLEFSPWQVSGTGNISALFFEAIVAEISKEKTTPQESKDKIRKYASWLSRGSVGMVGLSTVLSVAGALSVPLASVGASLAHQAGDKMKQASEATKAFAPDEPVDLKKLKAEISAELNDLTQQILVVIDDIDRLPAAEISEIIQLINVNANFPNLHYLLLFDRHTVEKSLQSVSAGRAREFLEKIIQVSYHVPALTRSELA